MEIITTLNTYSIIETLNPIFVQFSNQYIIENGIFFSKNPPCCPSCGKQMVHNGYNTLTKKNVATLKIGKYRCQHCKKNLQESREFFETLQKFLQDNITPMILKMRWNKMSYRGIEEVLEHIFPIGKDTIYSLIQETISSMEPPDTGKKDLQILGYDEQFVRIGGQQKYRLLIFDIESGTPIIDTLVSDKKSETIKGIFLESNIDFSIPTVVVTDLDRAYPQILDELFGENLLHQPCLFHLQKLIANSYSENCSLYDELLKYQLLNIFYDHSHEIDWLSQWIEEEKKIQNSCSKPEYREWLKNKKSDFYQICKNINSTKPSKKKDKTLNKL